jgi:TonB family protein
MKGCAEQLVGAYSVFLIVPLALVMASSLMAKTAGENAKAPLYSEVLDELITHPLPEYPQEARDRWLQGKGNYLVAFNSKTGAVQDVLIVRSAGSTVLDKAVMDSLRHWKVKPKTIEKVYVPVTFSLNAHLDDRTESQSNPNVLYAPHPRFPGSYKWDYASAKGVYEMQIDQATGRVSSVRLVETMGDDRLDNFASLTLRHWRFRPQTLSRFVITLGF